MELSKRYLRTLQLRRHIDHAENKMRHAVNVMNYASAERWGKIMHLLEKRLENHHNQA